MTSTANTTDHSAWIQTYTGKQFHYLACCSGEIDIRDIAVSLAAQVRFLGHTMKPYHVAEHCVHASHLVVDELAIYALLHDAAEAYIGDVPRPLKMMLGRHFELLELEIMRTIALRFDLDPQQFQDPAIHYVDGALLAAERNELMRTPPAKWGELPPPAKVSLMCWDYDRCYQEFMSRFDELTPAKARRAAR
jgi:hypothetical protein